MSAPGGDLQTGPQRVWAAGDFSKIGAASVIVGELLCEAVRLHAGEKVLDVATGAGNTAISAARRGTEVTGVDFVPALLARAGERAQAEGLKKVTFQMGDAEALPFPKHSFDVVLSTFGHMFAPDPSRSASEMARVCRPGGRIGFTAWTPGGFNGVMFKLNAAYTAKAGTPPAGPPPVAWGEENVVRERFGPYAAGFVFERRFLTFRAVSPHEWLAHMREFFGPARVLWEKLDEAARVSLTGEMLDLIGRFNQSGDSTMFVPGEYLETVVSLR
jgi:SAM-dependent methyltransferase